MKKDPKDLMWGVYVYTTDNIAPNWCKKQVYDEEVWDFFIEECPKNGINTIYLSAMDNIIYPSHPEIALEDAWDQERLHKELDRCYASGMKVIPELNFSSGHSYWLKEYRRATSTKVYYQVVKDLLEDAYELFNHPEYILISMDEEFYTKDRLGEDIAIIRKQDLLIHDIRYMVDIIKGLGATPLVFYDSFRMYPEAFRKEFSKDDLVMVLWHYLAIRPEHFRLDEENPGKMFEERPWVVRDLRDMELVVKSDYNLIHMMSWWGKNPYCHLDGMEYIQNNVSEDRLIGYVTTSWMLETKEYMDEHVTDLRLFTEARKERYGI